MRRGSAGRTGGAVRVLRTGAADLLRLKRLLAMPASPPDVLRFDVRLDLRVQLLAKQPLLPAALALAELEQPFGVGRGCGGYFAYRKVPRIGQAPACVDYVGWLVAADLANRLGRQVGRVGLDQ